jgi:hypothetical protein
MVNVGPGRYYVRAIPKSARTAADGTPIDASSVYFPQARRIEEARAVEVISGGEVSAIDLTIKPVPIYRVMGKVIDGETGKPVSQGSLNASHGDRLTMFGAHSPIAADGSFRLEGLPAGHYRVNFFGPQWVGRIFKVPSMEFELGENDVRGVVFTVKSGAVLRGRFVADSGLPTGLSVSVMPHEGGILTHGSVPVQADGSFEYPHIYPGDYDLILLGSNTWYIRGMRWGRLDVTDVGILIRDNAPLPELEVSVDSRVSRVSGSVVDERGAPQPSITVVLMNAPTKRWPEPTFQTATTGLDGHYEIQAVRPGEHRLLAWPRVNVLALRDPQVLAQLQTETVAVRAATSSVVQDVKLTSRTRAVAEHVEPTDAFPKNDK